jgi:hypothetical protein
MRQQRSIAGARDPVTADENSDFFLLSGATAIGEAIPGGTIPRKEGGVGNAGQHCGKAGRSAYSQDCRNACGAESCLV